MIEASFAYTYVNNIPWNKSPIFAFSKSLEEYLKAFERVLGKAPNKESKVDFSNDIWDFNPYYTDINSNSYRFLFISVPDEIKVYCKFYVLHTIMDKRKLSTINTRFMAFYDLIGKILIKTNHKNFFLITTNDIINEIESRNIKPNTKANKYLAIYQLYRFFKMKYQLDLLIDLNVIETKIKENRDNGGREYDKVPNIPNEYFNIILSKMVQLMRNESENYEVRATAALTIILSQTGLRLSDLVGLKVGQIFSKKLVRSGFETHYIKYQTRKTSRANSPLVEFNIFCNELCTEAFKTLIEIREKSPLSKSNEFIYVIEAKKKLNQRFPIDTHIFQSNYNHIFRTYLLDMASRPWPGINETKWIQNTHNNKYIFKKMYIPDTRQYRVHLCTVLYEKKVPLVFIMKYMGHLSEQMAGYYARPKDTFQENVMLFERVIRELVEDDITPLGGLYGKEIKKSIEDFIKDNNLSIVDDISSITEKFGDKLIIRGKTGGVCIKTSLIPCSKDARSNEVLCAYNLCQNLFHFYYMIDLTLLDFNNLKNTYEVNLKNNREVAAQKELFKIISLCRQRLLPELEELKKEIERKGIQNIINIHPNLIDIIENKESIESEVRKWMGMN